MHKVLYERWYQSRPHRAVFLSERVHDRNMPPALIILRDREQVKISSIHEAVVDRLGESGLPYRITDTAEVSLLLVQASVREDCLWDPGWDVAEPVNPCNLLNNINCMANITQVCGGGDNKGPAFIFGPNPDPPEYIEYLLLCYLCTEQFIDPVIRDLGLDRFIPFRIGIHYIMNRAASGLLHKQ